jgi:hypothetical protein
VSLLGDGIHCCGGKPMSSKGFPRRFEDLGAAEFGYDVLFGTGHGRRSVQGNDYSVILLDERCINKGSYIFVSKAPPQTEMG